MECITLNGTGSGIQFSAHCTFWQYISRNYLSRGHFMPECLFDFWNARFAYHRCSRHTCWFESSHDSTKNRRGLLPKRWNRSTDNHSIVCQKHMFIFFFLLATTPTQTTRFVKYWILAHLGFLSRTFPEQRFVTRCRVVKMAALPAAGLRLKYVATVSDSGSSSNMLWLGSIYEDN